MEDIKDKEVDARIVCYSSPNLWDKSDLKMLPYVLVLVIMTGYLFWNVGLIFFSPVVVKKPSPITTEKVLHEELIFKVVDPVKPTEGLSALPIGSVLVEGKNPNPDERDVVLNAQVIPFREISVGTEVNIYIICDIGISPQSFFYLAVEKR